jgi:D-alanyl-lipoteichoic acid acyltransferase DltB (MBOAT superfamily)
MLFNSQVFILFFLPAVLGGFYALAGSRPARQGFLILASFGFYAWWDIRFVPLLAGLTLANWLIARAFQATLWRWVPLAGVALNLGVLALFKYADFLRGTAFGLAGAPWQPWALILPLGISFFVFQKISYLVDLRRGDRHFYGLADFFLFVTFFPQLIAGPLVRHTEIVPQFARDPRGPAMWENLGRGLVLFIIGAAKKTALADTLAPLADPAFAAAAHGTIGAAEAWVATGAYTLQIYFDFSGYSDMAIGLALMFGLRLPLNFNAPYRAISVRDFWARWHMTLSRFLRDYLYIPLGGNRCGPARRTANLVATMLLGGLWHGANWTFVAWGGLHGAALAVNHVWSARGRPLARPLAWALTLLFVMACWVLFRAPDFAAAGRMFAALAGGGGIGTVAIDREHVAALVLGTLIVLALPTSQTVAFGRWRPRPVLAVPAGAALAFLVLLAGGRLQNAFIYFQF